MANNSQKGTAMLKTNSERQKEHYDRQKSAGLIHVKFWIKPAWRSLILKFIESLQ